MAQSWRAICKRSNRSRLIHKHSDLSPRVPQRKTRSTKLYNIGTIIRKKENRQHKEGEIINYDPINQLYKVQYLDDEKHDYTHKEIKEMYKHEQKYSHQKYSRKPQIRALFTNTYDNNFNYSMFPPPKHQFGALA